VTSLLGDQPTSARPALGGVEADAVHQRVERAAEHQRVGGVAHLAVVANPLGGDLRLIDGQRLVAAHDVLPRSGPSGAPTALGAAFQHVVGRAGKTIPSRPRGPRDFAGRKRLACGGPNGVEGRDEPQAGEPANA
jgi:hypothetical protein